jgi:pyruvate dehydrogenase E2 component (dihydrolipoamide acetyltransferase)
VHVKAEKEGKLSTNITIPKLGMTMKEATLVEWKFNEGDWVEKDEVVLIIETEKTTWEVEAMASGYLHILIACNPDQPEPVGKVVGQLAETEEELKSLQQETGIAEVPVATEAPTSTAKVSSIGSISDSEKGERFRASPLAKKMAKEHKLDLGTVVGTGPGGRITKDDVEKAIELKKKAPSETPVAGAVPDAGEYDGKRIKATISLKSGMRKAIASHMQRSLAISAQLTLMGEIDMTEAQKLRTEFLKQEEDIQTRITYTDIFVFILTKVLKEHPMINSSLIDNEIKIWEDINIGVAVALESDNSTGGGLIVPVIKHADQKSLVEISKELKELIGKAREGRILPDEVTGSTFTITNLGGAGGGYGFGTPIINQPESAILGTGAITDRPVVREGEIVIRPIMTYSFTFDHRVVDGAPAAAFMSALTMLIESPGLMICL